MFRRCFRSARLSGPGLLSIFILYVFLILYLASFRSSQPTQESNERIEILPVEEKHDYSIMKRTPVIGVLVLVFDRLTVIRTLNQILKYRRSPSDFPVVVSFDSEQSGQNVKELLNEVYVHDNLTIIQHPNYEAVSAELTKVPEHMQGYYHLSAHYHWALNYMFRDCGYEAVIIIEDDLDISPDIFEYFAATYPLLDQDSSLWCVSAYNDNGKPPLIDKNSPELLHRSDFFPGLGWMLRRSLWDELESKWPESFWDDWMREPGQRKNRACIRPEISRSKTYGKKGASSGQFFEQHLNRVVLNDKFIKFSQLNLRYLLKKNYDSALIEKLKAADVLEMPPNMAVLNQQSNKSQLGSPSFLLKYRNERDFEYTAKWFGLMTDFKAGIPRGSYQGIVSFSYKGARIYLASTSEVNRLLQGQSKKVHSNGVR